MKTKQEQLNEVTLRRLREAYAERPSRKGDEMLFKTAAAGGPPQRVSDASPSHPPAQAAGQPIVLAGEFEAPARFRIAGLGGASDARPDRRSSEDGDTAPEALDTAMERAYAKLGHVQPRASIPTELPAVMVLGPRVFDVSEEPVAEAPREQTVSECSSPDRTGVTTASGQSVAQPAGSERVGELLSLISDRVPISLDGTTIRLSAESVGAGTKWFSVQAAQFGSGCPLGRPVNVPVRLTVSIDQEIEPLAEEIAATIMARLKEPPLARLGNQERYPPPLSAPAARPTDAGLLSRGPQPPAPTPQARPLGPRLRAPGRGMLVAGVIATVFLLAFLTIIALAATALAERGYIGEPTGGIASRPELPLAVASGLGPEIRSLAIPGSGPRPGAPSAAARAD
jgi:hypothetical protein